MKWLKNALSAIVGVAVGAVGWAQMQAQKVEDKWENYRTAKFATFNPQCPYIKTNADDYRRAWDRQYPYDAVIVMFAKNQKQYYPDLDEEKAKLCFVKPGE